MTGVLGALADVGDRRAVRGDRDARDVRVGGVRDVGIGHVHAHGDRGGRRSRAPSPRRRHSRPPVEHARASAATTASAATAQGRTLRHRRPALANATRMAPEEVHSRAAERALQLDADVPAVARAALRVLLQAPLEQLAHARRRARRKRVPVRVALEDLRERRRSPCRRRTRAGPARHS